MYILLNWLDIAININLYIILGLGNHILSVFCLFYRSYSRWIHYELLTKVCIYTHTHTHSFKMQTSFPVIITKNLMLMTLNLLQFIKC